jgi:hypothetical protein
VDEVIKENELTTVKADPSLIRALQDAPITIEEITATPDLNYIFIPSGKVKFSPQNFSFNKSHESAQDLGQFIFVQNKESAWNSYVTVTNFVSTTGKGTIPVSAVTITPGEIRMISTDPTATVIESGDQKTLQNSFDKSLLVSIQPQDDSEAIFVMNPKINVTIPPGTPPGIYHAEISIKTL